MNKIKGFTLTEILAVIVILGVLLTIAIFSVNKYIERGNKTAFFTSVSNIVNNVKINNVIDETDFCMYNYKDDKENQNELIGNMYVLVHKENDKLIYSVYAKGKNTSYKIDTYDFSMLESNNESLWEEEYKKGKSFTYLASELSGIFDTSQNSEFHNLKKYKICK